MFGPAIHSLMMMMEYGHMSIIFTGFMILGESSTSHIEQYWSQIKQIISKIYVIMPKVGYIYYIREAEFRLSLKNGNVVTTEKSVIKLLENAFDICNYDFLSEDDIKDNNNYDY